MSRLVAPDEVCLLRIDLYRAADVSDSPMIQLSHSPVMLHEACPVVSVWYVLRYHWCARRIWVVQSTTS